MRTITLLRLLFLSFSQRLYSSSLSIPTKITIKFDGSLRNYHHTTSTRSILSPSPFTKKRKVKRQHHQNARRKNQKPKTKKKTIASCGVAIFIEYDDDDHKKPEHLLLIGVGGRIIIDQTSSSSSSQQGDVPTLLISSPLSSANVEYEGLILALRWIDQNMPRWMQTTQLRMIDVVGDCRTVIDQMNGVSIPRKTRWQYDKACSILKSILDHHPLEIKFRRVKREKNAVADGICDAMLDALRLQIISDMRKDLQSIEERFNLQKGHIELEQGQQQQQQQQENRSLLSLMNFILYESQGWIPVSIRISLFLDILALCLVCSPIIEKNDPKSLMEIGEELSCLSQQQQQKQQQQVQQQDEEDLLKVLSTTWKKFPESQDEKNMGEAVPSMISSIGALLVLRGMMGLSLLLDHEEHKKDTRSRAIRRFVRDNQFLLRPFLITHDDDDHKHKKGNTVVDEMKVKRMKMEIENVNSLFRDPRSSSSSSSIWENHDDVFSACSKSQSLVQKWCNDLHEIVSSSSGDYNCEDSIQEEHKRDGYRLDRLNGIFCVDEEIISL